MLMIGKPLTADQRLRKAVVDIIARDQFVALSGVLMVLQQTVEPKGCDKPTTRTACTNGLRITYAEEFVDSLSDAELRFLVLHEAFHCMYQHLTTWEWMYRECAELANAACDYAINIQLFDMAEEIGDGFLKMPESGLIDPKYRGMDSAKIYKLLKQEDEEGDDDEDGESEGGEPCEDGDEGTGSGPGGEPGKPGNNQGRGRNRPQGFDEHDWEGASSIPDDEKAEIGRKLDEAMRQGALLAGKLGTGGERILGDLLAAKVRWQDALREFMHSVCAGSDYSTWRRPNRRFVSAGVYMPSAISETLGEIVIAVDTSGSIGGPELSQFLGEINAICSSLSPEVVRLLYWDTEVVRAERYEREQLHTITQSTKPAGGGGTSPSCITRYLAESNIHAQVVVVLTDGYVGTDWGGVWPCPVVWCIVGNERAVPAIGKAVHVEWDR